MGKGCITVTKYFLFLFNLLFFVSKLTSMSLLQGPAATTADPLLDCVSRVLSATLFS